MGWDCGPSQVEFTNEKFRPTLGRRVCSFKVSTRLSELFAEESCNMKTSNLTARARLAERKRRGAFTVEFAVVSSIFFVVLLACFEFSRIFFARHTIEQASYEAARLGIIQGNTVSEVEQRATKLMAAAGIKPLSVSVSPVTFNELTEEVSVTIVCNVAENSWIPSRFFLNPTITATTTLDHENKSYLLIDDTDDEVGDNDHEPIDI